MFTKPMKNKLHIAYDIGHSSIGWAVLLPNKPHPEILGCGSVIFPKDDCLASARRGHRRSRRNIRATRNRVARLKTLLLHLGVLSKVELDATGHAAPHVLAARAILNDAPILSWKELWHVLRWYAHNRGYDGNSRWSRQEESGDDTDKEKAAIELMRKYDTTSMAETICSVLEIDPPKEKISSSIPYKTLNAAFPRKIVRDEILSILEKHKGHLKQLDGDFITTLIASDEDSGKQAWATIPVPDIKLPRRYFGGLLFGQLIPRFDNRIIAKCPISGDKVPNKATREFLQFRWAMILANIRADGKALTVEQRGDVHAAMEKNGRLTGKELRQAVEEICATTKTNIEAYFELHPDSEDALVLDPALALFQGVGPGSLAIKPFWEHLPEVIQYRALGRWKKGRLVTLQWMLDQCNQENHDSRPLTEAINSAFEKDQQKSKPAYLTEEHHRHKAFAPKPLSGRAPYSRSVMRETFDFVLSTEKHPMEEGGPLYPSKGVLNAERNRPIDDLTNNHLIRQRLTILLRLTDDIIENYADGDAAKISDIVVEVARDLQEYSGLTAKEMAGELTKRLSHFKSAVKHLEKFAPDLPVTGSLIRKCRIAMDMDWKCPFTGKRYDPLDLQTLEREHVIPYADRPTNSLDSLVLTFDWVNKLKGKRTGLEFIKAMADDERFLTPKQYETLVGKLKVANKDIYPDDFRRQSSRKKLMMVEHYESKDHGFTQGALTQTSHLNRLSARQLEKRFSDPDTGECSVHITSIPGQVTAEIRKSWDLLGTLAQACPDILQPSIQQLEADAKEEALKDLKKQIKAGTLSEQDRDDIVATYIANIPDAAKKTAGKTKNKTDIRSITHLHHALDAATIALTNHYLPGIRPGQKKNEKGAIWQAILKRNKSTSEIALLMQTGMFVTKSQKNGNSEKLDARLTDIQADLKNQLAERLAEKRVIQHVPADQTGASLELNQWRVWHIDGDPNDPKTEIVLRQQSSIVKDGLREITRKETKEKAGKLIGLKAGKLAKNKAVLVISENYGLALDPEPTIIPFHNVPGRLAELRGNNGGKYPRILRNGMLINIKTNPPRSSQDYTGIWRIASLKNNSSGPALDIIRPGYISTQNGVEWAGMNKTLAPLLECGLEIIHSPFTGISPPD